MQINNQLLGGPFDVVQGDTVLFYLTAVDGDGNPVDITAATFTTNIKGPNGSIESFPTGQHAVVDGPSGTFTLALSSDDSLSLGLGEHKEIVTQMLISTSTYYFRGINLLSVYDADPAQ